MGESLCIVLLTFFKLASRWEARLELVGVVGLALWSVDPSIELSYLCESILADLFAKSNVRGLLICNKTDLISGLSFGLLFSMDWISSAAVSLCLTLSASYSSKTKVWYLMNPNTIPSG